MSEQGTTHERLITGLARPRPAQAGGGGVHLDVSRLIRANRDPTVPATQMVSTYDALQPEQEQSEQHVRSSRTAQLNVAINSDARDRLRAVYRATSNQEGHRSFAAFVEDALIREAERLEAKYNAGQHFAGGEHQLTPGRPLGS
jgi:hypothetical protein